MAGKARPAAAGRQPRSTGAPRAKGSELASKSTSDVISEDWWLRFSDYRLEDYYAEQARLDNEAGRPFPMTPANRSPDHADTLQTVIGILHLYCPVSDRWSSINRLGSIHSRLPCTSCHPLKRPLIANVQGGLID